MGLTLVCVAWFHRWTADLQGFVASNMRVHTAHFPILLEVDTRAMFLSSFLN